MDAEYPFDMFEPIVFKEASGDIDTDHLFGYLLGPGLDMSYSRKDLPSSPPSHLDGTPLNLNPFVDIDLEVLSTLSVSEPGVVEKDFIDEVFDTSNFMEMLQSPLISHDSRNYDFGPTESQSPLSQSASYQDCHSLGCLPFNSGSFEMALSALQPLQPQQPNLPQRVPILTLADTFQSPFSAVDLTCLPFATLPSDDIFSDTGFTTSESMSPTSCHWSEWSSSSSQSSTTASPPPELSNSYLSQSQAITSKPFYGIDPLSASQDPMICDELTLEAVLRDLMSQTTLETTHVKANTQQSHFPHLARSQSRNEVQLGLGGDKERLPFNICNSMKHTVDLGSFSDPLQLARKRQKPMSPSPTSSITWSQARDIKLFKDLDNDYNQPSPHKRKPSRTKRVTDSAHYRPRNAFFMFRGFVSRFQSAIRPKSTVTATKTTTTTAKTGAVVSMESSAITPSFSLSVSPASSFYLPPTLMSLPSASASIGSSTLTRATGQGVAQTKVSVSCGRIWSSECFEYCGAGGCANCRMRSLFGQASDFLKLRQTELERQIEFSEVDDCHNKLNREANTAAGAIDKGSNGLCEESGSRGGLVRLALEDSFNWKEFQQLYYDSDLFKWHRDKYLWSNGSLDIEEMKRVWMENERCYEKVFLEGARRRILQDGSRNVKKAGQRLRKISPTC